MIAISPKKWHKFFRDFSVFMNCHYASRVTTAKKSFIKEMLQIAQQREIISFAGGIPNAGLFPLSELKEISRNVLEKYGHLALQYATTEGYPPLRQLLAEIFSLKLGLMAKPENILITSGSQQGIDLVGKIFLDVDDEAVVEEPSYVGAIEALAAYGPRLTAIPLVADGIDLDALQHYLRHHRPKLFYTVPTFQNPSGTTYSREKRLAVAELLAAHDVVLVEDDPYRELRFAGDELLPITACMHGRGLFLGSCSKIIAPGLRVASIFGPQDVIEKLVAAKQASDVHSSILSQIFIYEYLTRYDFQEHLRRVRGFYGNNRELMIDAIRHSFPDEVTYTMPEGGMFLWVRLPERCSSMALFHEAIARKVAFVPGDPFFVNDCDSNCFRLSYCTATPEEIERGITILGETIKANLAH